MQRGPLDGRSGQLHRIEVGDGGDGSGASHLEIDAFEPRERLFGLELESHGPSGRLGREAQLAPQGVTIDLDDHAVRSERQFPALFVPEGDVVVDLRLAAADPHLVRYVESPFAGFPHTLPMGRAGQVVASQLVERAVQPPLGDYGRGLLLERARCGIARIGQQRFAVLLAFAVEAVERGIGHQHFAPYFEEIGVVAPLQVQRNGANRADIGRYVIAPCAVAPRHGTEQSSVFVGERDGRAVELQLTDQVGGPHLPLDAVDELVQLVERVGVAQREHREAVADGPKVGGQVAAHAHRRRVGVGILGILPLEVDELAHHRVELEVGDFGGVFDVIFIVVAVELPAELLDSFLGCHRVCPFAARCRVGRGGGPSRRLPPAKRPAGQPVGALNNCCVKVRNLFRTSSKFEKNAIKNIPGWCGLQILRILAENFYTLVLRCTMTKQNSTKKHIVASLHNLSPELQEAVREKYPLGFTDAMMRVDKPNGDFFYAVPFDTDEVAYLVKIDVKVDDHAQDDDDKDYYDDEIKGADEIQDDGSSEGLEETDDDIDI